MAENNVDKFEVELVDWQDVDETAKKLSGNSGKTKVMEKEDRLKIFYYL